MRHTPEGLYCRPGQLGRKPAPGRGPRPLQAGSARPGPPAGLGRAAPPPASSPSPVFSAYLAPTSRSTGHTGGLSAPGPTAGSHQHVSLRHLRSFLSPPTLRQPFPQAPPPLLPLSPDWITTCASALSSRCGLVGMYVCQ